MLLEEVVMAAACLAYLGDRVLVVLPYCLAVLRRAAWLYACYGVLVLAACSACDGGLCFVLPCARAWRVRLGALLAAPLARPDQRVPVRAWAYLVSRTAMTLANAPVWGTLWLLDELLFPAYRTTPLHKPVFIVGGFRTGSTSLHRCLALDEDRFFSPRFLELALPFLVVHYVLDALEKRFPHVVDRIEQRLQDAAGPDVMARHPMSYHEAEEDDVLFSMWQWAGYYSIVQFPHADAWLDSSCAAFSAADQERFTRWYGRVLRKVALRRGRGRRLLSKSHLIDSVARFEGAFGGQLVAIARKPQPVFLSWLGLAQAASASLAGAALPSVAAARAHLSFWDAYYATEAGLFKHCAGSGGGGSDEGKAAVALGADGRAVVRFDSFIGDQRRTCETLYAEWKLPFDGTDFQAALVAKEGRAKTYKQRQKYVNPTFADVGVEACVVADRYKTYTDSMRLQC